MFLLVIFGSLSKILSLGCTSLFPLRNCQFFWKLAKVVDCLGSPSRPNQVIKIFATGWSTDYMFRSADLLLSKSTFAF